MLSANSFIYMKKANFENKKQHWKYIDGILDMTVQQCYTSLPT